jgi:hypothetical protein
MNNGKQTNTRISEISESEEKEIGQEWWYTPVIQSTQEAEIRGSQFESRWGKKQSWQGSVHL